MQFVTINNITIYYLKKFLNNKLSKNFRYYEKRDISVIENHIVTIIGLEDNLIPIAYGHIDYCKEQNIYWLGICILDEYQGKGFGNQMMIKLIEIFKEKQLSKELYLTIDKDNQKAYNLYKKFNFNLIEDTNTYYKMKLLI
jgi:ribosomal protein S18 acetylase RimI-like enzyme